MVDQPESFAEALNKTSIANTGVKPVDSPRVSDSSVENAGLLFLEYLSSLLTKLSLCKIKLA